MFQQLDLLLREQPKQHFQSTLLQLKPIDSRDAMRITAITSSTIKTPKTSIDDSFFILPASWSILIIIAVLLIDNAADMNNESIKFRPRAVAARKNYT